MSQLAETADAIKSQVDLIAELMDPTAERTAREKAAARALSTVVIELQNERDHSTLYSRSVELQADTYRVYKSMRVLVATEVVLGGVFVVAWLIKNFLH